MYSVWRRAVCLALAALLFSAGAAWCQGKAYPTKPIDVIVPWAPGAGTDISGRLVATYASKKFGVPVNVVNITGASGITGISHVLKAKPDGYTLLTDGNAMSSFLFATRTDLPMKLEDRTYIARATVDWLYFFANIDSGWKTLDDALKVLRSRPEDFRWGAGAYASSPMFSQVALFQSAGIDMNTIKKSKMVVFEKGNTPSLQACITGDVQFAVGWATDVEPTLATKRVRVLAVNAPERTKEYPDVPTVKELGCVGPQLMVWYGLSGPKGIPDAAVKRWDDLIRGAMNDPEAQAAASKLKKVWAYLPANECKAFVLKEYQHVVPIATELGLRAK